MMEGGSWVDVSLAGCLLGGGTLSQQVLTVPEHMFDDEPELERPGDVIHAAEGELEPGSETIGNSRFASISTDESAELETAAACPSPKPRLAKKPRVSAPHGDPWSRGNVPPLEFRDRELAVNSSMPTELHELHANSALGGGGGCTTCEPTSLDVWASAQAKCGHGRSGCCGSAPG